MAAVQHRATTRTSNTDNSTTKTKSKATSARKSPATKRKRVSAETARAAAALKGLAVEAPAPSIEANEPGQFGRINVMDITPAEERGIFPARVELGEPFEMTAQVFIEGRTKVGATAIVRNPRGKETMRRAMTCVNPGLDRWTVMVKCGEHSDLKPWEDGYAAVKRQLGEWTVTIEGWEDAYVSWLHDARIKVRVMDDVDNALNSGAELLARWAETPDTGLTARDRKTLEKAAETMADQTLSAEDRLAAGDNPTIAALHETHPLRDGISPSQPQRFKVERPKSSFAAWYQFFPRSEGATIDPNTGKIIQGTLKTSMAGLERAAAEGFDIVYLPPVFPIGVTNRKGRNNTLVAGPDDPGSPFGIGSELGGHDTVDPLLGTMDDFKALCQRAHELGLEIALDFALQCSPDHPWVKAHPNWFRHKPDGSIAFAENPPKKYQDIYPIDFNADMPGIEKEVERIMNLWIEAGVTIFRIDNPHTKPVRFWQDVIAAVTKKHPEILFLAEAFTRPGMMRALSYVGFTQSHCYFPWRNTKDELEEYLPVTNGDDGYYQHNTFWPTTPDILTAYVRDNGVAGHCVRAVLAAMGSPSWGIYNGYELIENKQRPSFEEQIDNEKYEVKVRDWSKAKQYGVAEMLTALNKIRRAHPAALSYHNLTVLPTSDPNILAFARHTPAELTGTGQADTLIVVVNLDGHNAHQSMIHLELSELGLPTDRPLNVRDELTGREFQWGWDNYVSLAPWADVAHILSVQ
ncbi:alpha-1,4-glucan--maltose-1-phosphate maltosyltransferase [Bifidobacterium longum subsp. longum]|uniref:Alpha-1,4-glucan:maltose-1-phosphate maltosyltransferase n=1 Tax=Bifidobacterium longum subsp. longum TaxID=1679 RepID=A0A4R0V9F3_BIFLL|nr:alpha-1,4-glucan--maltose-1-phosphate maltosyltransferase [Bifidobacterium longum]AXF97947.1 alpha-1,4-glucan--maltose-1-phosphate maltosyltransferase [Bifidobacterium longum subsp. longum]RGX35972.1 alpha-1,4-glucan--maltose-1-phosphate maltosyltransferase [Bifidobacterium longum]RGX40021.1 alpha-1,4-glucan--maltose-1-phosphate maltosyltransferase [Bifidobacterium longum]RGX47835.1 alpha-1,4-glucan--maltose-1-phosphate maltosyltransferase [Bifidobacterium longum]TCE71480.1 Alpha-amylase fa